MRLGEAADPQAGKGEVVLRVAYAALNPADRYLAEGRYPGKAAMPHILGRDGVGEVVAVGEGVDKALAGKRRVVLRSEVGVSRWGTFAELVSVPTESTTEVPAGWDEQQVAGAPLVYMTAYQALTQWEDLPPRAVVLITGASGGVGVASAQLAKAMGHTSIAISRSEEKRKRLTELGADAVFDPEQVSGGAVKEWLNGMKRRVDLIIDNVAGALLPEAINLLADRGRVSVVGREAGEVPNFNTATLFFRRIRIGGVAVGAYTPAESQAAWGRVVEMMNRTGARPVVDSVFEFENVKEAFERLGKASMGKVLVRVSA